LKTLSKKHEEGEDEISAVECVKKKGKEKQVHDVIEDQDARNTNRNREKTFVSGTKPSGGRRHETLKERRGKMLSANCVQAERQGRP